MSNQEAMSKFISLLDENCFLFKPYIDAHVAQNEEKKRKELEDKEHIESEEKAKLDQQPNGEVSQETTIEEKKRQLIQDALNQQTYSQFRAYAEDQVLTPLLIRYLGIVISEIK